jgi:hypothetical protein
MVSRFIRMDSRIIAYGLLEDGRLSLPFMTSILLAQGSWWESWGIGIGALFVSLEVMLIVMGLLRHGGMKPAWGNWFMITSLFFGIYSLILAGIFGTGSQENLSYCGSNLVDSVAIRRCQAGEAQAFGVGILIVNAIGLALVFFSSWNWLKDNESPMP